MEFIYLGDYGIELVLATNTDLSEASNTKIHYRKPDDTEGYWVTNVSGENLVYTLQSEDFDQIGVWRLHAYAELNGPIHGAAVMLKVLSLFVP